MWNFNTRTDILAMAEVGIFITDLAGTILDANPFACELFGYSPDALMGRWVQDLLHPRTPCSPWGRARPRRNVATLLRAHTKDPAAPSELLDGIEVDKHICATGYRQSGQYFPVDVSIAKLRNDNDEWQLVFMLRDTTSRRKTEEELMDRATHDELTGLPNQTLLRERLQEALERSLQSNLQVAVLFIDLDGFKWSNQTYGHEGGDALLKIVATRLLRQIRTGDMAARLGGDQFALLCEDVESTAAISALASRISNELQQPMRIPQGEVSITASIGIVMGSGDTHSVDVLLNSANSALSAIKAKGRNGWQYFDQTLQAQNQQRAMVVQGLRNAIQLNEFHTCFQPIVAADSARIVGAELLLRWRPSSGEVSPAVFIPIAENSGSICAIGEWVFRRGCEAEVDWRTRWGTAAPAYLSINVSPRQLLDANLARLFERILRETGADPSRIVLEITETALMEDVESNLIMLRQLVQLGLRFAVDDFGTGYSSLAQLTRMPVSVLKIDKAFINEIATDAESRAVVHAIVGLGRSLGLKMVAEGVENEAQLLELRDHNCDYIQGYLFHRPLAMEQFRMAVADNIAHAHEHAHFTLFSLLYVSEACYPMDDASLADIVAVSRRKNQQMGITGCLLYQDGYFMQLLEGPQQHVLTLMDSIRADVRHRHVTVVAEGVKSHRIFMGWSMGFQNILEEGATFFKPCSHPIHFMDLARDAKVCYTFISAFRPS